MLRILKSNQFFPGGYVYRQPETGFALNGNNLLPSNARTLLAHRKGNHLPRATYEECLEDIVTACCQRYPALCVNDSRAATQATFAVAAASSSPAAPRVVRRCGSCGGNKRK